MNIIKLITILLVEFLYSAKTFGQSKCVYSHSWGFSGVQIELLDSNEFIYHYEDCTSSKIGYGKYEQTERELKLTFRTAPPTLDSYVKKIDTFGSSNECILYVQVISENGLYNIEHASIGIKDSTGRYISGASSDHTGLAKLILKPSEQNAELSVSQLGYKKLTFPLQLKEGIYQFTIDMARWTQVIYGDGKIIKYKIRKKTKKVIQLSSDDDEPIEYKITCS